MVIPTEKNTLQKEERLTHTKRIEYLFSSGRWLRSEHVRLIYLIDEGAVEPLGASCKVLFSCPKKLHKRAVKRNLLKRRMREVYRLNKNNFYKQIENVKGELLLGFIIAVPIVLDYKQINKEMKKLLSQVEYRLNKPSS